MGKIVEHQAKHGRVDERSDSDIITLVQQSLLAAGAQLLDDGEWGPVTEAAIKRFQSAHNLPPHGWVGIRTSVLLDNVLGSGEIVIPKPLPSVLAVAPWVSYMRAITGTKELPGEADSPIIMSWKADITKAFPDMVTYTKNYTHDATPWCGLGEAWTMARSSVRPPFGKTDVERFLYARSWANWGTRLDTPIPGCVMVFSRAGGGHVTTLEKIQGKKVWCRGCNQTDMVNVITKTLDESFVGARWPTGWAIPKMQIAGDISNAVGEGSFA